MMRYSSKPAVRLIAMLLLMMARGALSQRAVVSNEGSGTVSVIDGRVVTATIDVGARPRGLALSRDGTRAYVARVMTSPVGERPYTVVLAP